MVFVFSAVERKLARNAIAFSKDVAPIELAGQPYVAAGDTLVMAEMMRLALEQGLKVFLGALAAMTFVLMLFFGGHFWQPLLGLFGGLGLMAGIMLVGGIDLNFYNMAVLSAVVGVGIDAVIHVFSAWRDRKGEVNAVGLALHEVRGPVTMAIVTTLLGYASMLFSHHPGIRSIGVLSVIGLLATFFVAIWLFPRALSPARRATESHLTQETPA